MITRGKGVTIAEMSMKSWIMQPGLMLTDWGTLGHSALSVLGILTLTGTFITILYTTASDVLGKLFCTVYSRLLSPCRAFFLIVRYDHLKPVPIQTEISYL